MCGIAGAVGAAADAALGRAMAGRLAHRGPDGEGLFAATAPLGPGRAEWRVVLAHRRLAVIDTSEAAAEPLPSEDGAVQLVFNGEIYNHGALRGRLVAGGHRFRSRTDAETIVHLYEDLGPACVRELRGMYAFAVLDRARGELFLARDPAGKKPLYYGLLPGGGLAFGSEVAAVLEAGVGREVDREALEEYLAVGYIAAPGTGFRDVRKLGPGGSLLIRNGEIVVSERGLTVRVAFGSLAGDTRKFLAAGGPGAPAGGPAEARPTPGGPLGGPPGDEPGPGPVSDPVKALRAAVIDAVRARVESDVPLGAFLSGGVDSTIVTGVLARLRREAGGPPVETFSIGFSEPGWSEAEWARLAAGRLGTVHHERTLDARAADALPLLAFRHGEPFADESGIATYHLAALARERVTVAMTGDGGDELFLGYRRHRAGRALAALDAVVPRAVRRGLAALAPAPGPEKTLRRDVGRLLAALGRSPEERYLDWTGIFPERGARVAARVRALGVERYDREVYLPDDVLAKVDRSTMAHALEARSPLLDRRVVAVALGLPARRNAPVPWESKRALKAAFADLLPPEIARRPKMGFGVPVGSWLRGPLRGLARDVLGSERARGRGLVEPAAALALLDEHDRGVEHGRRIWALLALESWFRQLVDPPRPERRDW